MALMRHTFTHIQILKLRDMKKAIKQITALVLLSVITIAGFSQNNNAFRLYETMLKTNYPITVPNYIISSPRLLS